jgi:hypothetical protein
MLRKLLCRLPAHWVRVAHGRNPQPRARGPSRLAQFSSSAYNPRVHKMAGNWDLQLVKELWRQIDSGSRYDWQIKRSAQERLLAILPAFPAYLFERPAEQLNKLLRVELSPPLKARDERFLSLASWIIRDLGGHQTRIPSDTAMDGSTGRF